MKPITFSTLILYGFLFFQLSEVSAQWEKWEPKTKNDRNVTITSIAFLDNFTYFGTQEAGVMKFDGTNFTFIDMNGGLVSNEVRAIEIDDEGNLWIATAKGLDMWNPKRIVHYSKGVQKGAVKFETDDFKALHIDGDGTLWIGTNKGLIRRTRDDQWIQWDQKSTNKALPTNEIRAIHSNWDGVIWLGTDKGLVSFDGKEWKVYNTDSHALPNNTINDVRVDLEGNVWIATNKGIGKFNGVTCQVFLKGKTIYAVDTDMLSAAWAASKDEGVFQVEGGSERFYNSKTGLISDELHALRIDRNNQIWAGGVLGFNRYFEQANAKKIASVIFDRAKEEHLMGQYATATHYYYLLLKKEIFRDAAEIPEAMYRIAHMFFYVGETDKGLDLLKEFVTRFPKHASVKPAILALADQYAIKKKVSESQKYYQLFLDNYPDDPLVETVLWKMAVLLEADGDSFGAARLLQKLNNKFRDHLRFDEAKYKIAVMEEKQKGQGSSDAVYADLAKSSADMEILYRLTDYYDQLHRRDIMNDMRGGVEWKTYEIGSGINNVFLDGTNLWIATQANGVVKCDINLGALTPYVDGLPGKDVRQVYMDADRDVWAVINGVSRNALCYMKQSRNQTKWTPMWGAFSNKAISWFIYRPTNKSNIAASDQGLIISGGMNKTYTSKNGLPGDKVKFVLLDSRNVLWLIVDKYLVQIDNEPKAILSTGEVEYNDVRGFYIDAKDTKWLATDKGIVTYDGNWKQYTTEDGLISNNTQCVVGSRGGMILVGTKEGLSFYNNTFWMNYTKEDGLPSNDVRAVLFAEDMSIWIGTDKGVHFRKSTGDGDKKLMVQNVLAQEKIFWEKKQWAKARELYNLLSVYADLSEWIAAKKALTFEKEGQVDNAYSAYMNIRSSNPTSRWVTDVNLYRIARRYEDSSRFDQAMRVYAELAERVRGDARKAFRIEESMYRIGTQYQAKNDFDRAMAIYKQVRKTYPNGLSQEWIANRYLEMMQVLESSKDLNKCIPLYEEFIREYPKHEKAVEIQFALAGSYESVSRLADAQKVYGDIIAAIPQRTPVRFLAERHQAKIKRHLSGGK